MLGTLARWLRGAWLWLSVVCCALSSPVQAGSPELLNSVSISPADPGHLVVSYAFGGAGLFVSEDGGATLRWLCSAGASPLTGSTRNLVTHASGDGSIYLGLVNGLLRGDKHGCGFEPVPELDKRFIRAISSDPWVPERTYLVTGNAMTDNGIYVNDGTGTFAPFGTHTAKFIDSLHVVKNGDGRRFFETGFSVHPETNAGEYVVRVSDDDGMTWTEALLDPAELGLTDMQIASFKIVAVDPTNPELVVGLLTRRDRGPNVLAFNRAQGKAGNWQLIAEPVAGGAVTFAPDGALYFGDDNFATKGLFKVATLGDAPQQVSDVYRVSCLGYDEASSRLLGCADNYRFGTFDLSSGELTTLLDLRCAEHAVQCSDKPEIQALCQPPNVEFCKMDHWVIAPLCCVYEREDLELYASSQTILCEGGEAKPKPSAAGEGGAPAISPVCSPPSGGSSGAAAGSSAGGAAAGSSGAAAAGSGGTAMRDDRSGCGCGSVSAAERGRAAAVAALTWLVLAARRRAGHRRRPREG